MSEPERPTPYAPTDPAPCDEPIRVLDEDGNVCPGADVPDLPDEQFLAMYEDLRLARTFDQRAISLQRQGRIATYAPMTGQEGSQVASGYALADEDWLFPTYRDHAAKYVHGMDLASVLAPTAGSREGYAIPDGVDVLPEYIPIATRSRRRWGWRGDTSSRETPTTPSCVTSGTAPLPRVTSTRG